MIDKSVIIKPIPPNRFHISRINGSKQCKLIDEKTATFAVLDNYDNHLGYFVEKLNRLNKVQELLCEIDLQVFQNLNYSDKKQYEIVLLLKRAIEILKEDINDR